MNSDMKKHYALLILRALEEQESPSFVSALQEEGWIRSEFSTNIYIYEEYACDNSSISMLAWKSIDIAAEKTNKSSLQALFMVSNRKPELVRIEN